jgi:hypothetical protein
MIAGFSFVHDDRTYTCVAEAGPGGASEPWWWFTVNRDGNRYAPFRATTKDTRSTVQGKIVAYYANHLAHRAMPESQHWARRPKGVAGAAPGTPGAIVLPPAVVAARALMAEKAAAAKAAELAAIEAVTSKAAASKTARREASKPVLVAAKPARPAAKPARPVAKIPARPAAKLRLVPKGRANTKGRASAKGR